MGERVRLDKFLATIGLGSRKDIKKSVRNGIVTVNGQTVKDSSLHINIGTDEVTVDGSAVVYKEFIYLILNKPDGYISATEDVRDATVLELVPSEFSHYDLFPVGRLDKDTEGLLILTNDGKLAHELLSPKKHVRKTYFVRVNGKVGSAEILQFAEGVILDDGYKTMPAAMKILTGDGISEVELTIHEGKFHQVKRMFQSVNMEVIYLKRIAMGGLQLDNNLGLGEVRELTPQELDMLKQG